MARAVISNPERRAAYEPLYDLDPRPGATIEVFFADRGSRSPSGEALAGIVGPAKWARCRTNRRLVHSLTATLRTAISRSLKVSFNPSRGVYNRAP